MQEMKSCHHLFSTCDGNFAYTTEDGIEIIVTIQDWHKGTTCGHVDSPISDKGTNKIMLNEKRNYPHSPKENYVHILDLF